MLYKLNAYFTHWGFPFEENSLILKFLVVSLATIEFIIGIYLLLGIRRRSTAIFTVVFMSAMTAMTAYIYKFNPVADCGCFGEALILSNSATLIKNIVLLIAALITVYLPLFMKRLISERNQWLTSIYSWAYIIILSILSFHYLPVINFTAFDEGTDIKAAWYGETDENTPEELINFTLFEEKSGEDMTESVLNDTNYTFLLTLPKISIADDGCNDRINDIYDDCLDNGYKFYAVVGDNSDSAAINNWIDRTGATYPMLKCDAILLKAMVRSNPGLMLLKEGTIINKWSNNNLPVLSADKDWNVKADNEGINKPLIRLLLWFIIPLLIIIFLDGIWIGSKYFKHYIFKRTLKNQKS